jgi:PST family polysaccharide transporter
LWANAAFWISTATGWLAAALVALAAPMTARAYGNSDLVGIMLVIALSIPLGSMSLVAEAKLQADLRFRYLAMLVAVWAAILPTLTVALAWAGLGVYALVIPRVIAAAVRMVMAMWGARPRLRWNPQLRRWRYIVGTSAVVLVTSLLLLVIQVGDRAILGAFVDESHVGLYWFAFAFSMQMIMMISINLEGVLFATLAKLNDEPARQLNAFLRASRVLASVVVPVCLIQAAASNALVHTVFDPAKWSDAAPAMQALGIGMLFVGSYCPATAMLMAQRRFGTRFRLAAMHAGMFVVLVGAAVPLGVRWGGASGGVTGAAIAVAATYALTSPIWSYVSTRPMGGTWGATLGIVARPLLASAVAVGLGLGLSVLAGRAAANVTVQGVAIEHWVRLAMVCGASGLAYVPLMRALMPAEYREIAAKAVAIVRRISPAWAERSGRALGV